MADKTVYYLINDRLLGKREGDYAYYLFRDGNWIKDENWLILGKLGGYDDSEPDDSPYGWGSTSVMDEIKEISKQEADRFIEETKRVSL